MEDTHIVETDLMQDGSMIGLYAVFDGHRGKYTSLYLQQSFASVLRTCIRHERAIDGNEMRYETALRNSFKTCEKGATLEYEARSNDDMAEWTITGSTAAVVLFVDFKTIYCANAGDSEVVVGRRGTTSAENSSPDKKKKSKHSQFQYAGVCLSTLHKPDTDIERERIERAGGYVSVFEEGIARVVGYLPYVRLSVSRSFGNSDVIGHETKEPLIIARPDIAKTDILDGDVLIVACDGLWDVYDYKDAVKDSYEYRNSVESNSTIPNTAEYLADRAIDVLKTNDNVTTIVVFLTTQKTAKVRICSSVEPISDE